MPNSGSKPPVRRVVRVQRSTASSTSASSSQPSRSSAHSSYSTFERSRGRQNAPDAQAPFQLLPIEPGLPADSLALAMLVAGRAIATVKSGQALNDGLAHLWRTHPELQGGAKGAVQDLIFGTLRDYGRGAFLLSRLLKQPLTEVSIEGLLLVALHRLEQRPDTAYVIVDQAVEAASHISRGGLKGLVNAVLRNAIRQKDELFAACERQGEAHWRHPDWWVEALRRAHPQHWLEIVEAGNTHPPMTLRINPLRTTLTEMQQQLAAAGHAIEIMSDEANEQAIHLLKPVPVASLPGYAEGWLSVQDWGAQQAAPLLDLRAGQRVLDACAAPGGKTTHMLELADIDLLALDEQTSRVERINAQLDRLGLNAQTRVADCRHPRHWWDGRLFDRILADVPCSASGVVRRHPDIKWLRRADDVGNFATVQRQIIDALWPLLAPGGKMLYVTCSVFPEENAQQMTRFVARHPDCRRVPFENGMLEKHCLPGPRHDGFFFALLEKTA